MKKILPILVFAFLFPLATFADSRTFNATGADQTFTVPAGVTSINVELFGAGGDDGGRGGITRGNLSVTSRQNIVVMVGKKGTSKNISTPSSSYGGGGSGGAGHSGGGGRSAIRIAGQDVMTAGGGGGWVNGSSGGGTTGGNAEIMDATQTSGGQIATFQRGSAGSKYKGGDGGYFVAEGGGGGGWYGGASTQRGGWWWQIIFKSGGGSGYCGGAGVSGCTTTTGAGSAGSTDGKVIITWSNPPSPPPPPTPTCNPPRRLIDGRCLCQIGEWDGRLCVLPPPPRQCSSIICPVGFTMQGIRCIFTGCPDRGCRR